jgi:asparagine synthase (glutamine-hydrolysing)
MCGIVGGVGERSRQVIELNLDLLARRGPDHQQVLSVSNQLTFGATRLAMTDPHPRSHQPMVDENSGNVLIFNGEIYNFKKIKKELEAHGLRFKTESDTEVVLQSLSFFGNQVIDKLEGMFAFAFFNKKDNSILLARDYLGKKPLYFLLDKHRLFFASQLDFIKKFKGNVDIDLFSVFNYLKYGYIFDPNSIYEGIRAVIPGEYLVIDLNNLTISEQKNYIPYSISHPIPTDIRQQISTALLERVAGHEDKFALSLSGGIDSTILAIECSRLRLPVSTYSLDFGNSDKLRYRFDSKAAEQISTKLGHKFKKVQFPNAKQIPKILNEFVKAMGEPNANPTGLSMMHLYSQISNDGQRLVLTGDGSDEVFGGYERHNLAKKFDLLPRTLGLKSENSLLKLDFLPDNILKFLIALSPWNSPNLWIHFHKIIDNKTIREFFNYQIKSNNNYYGVELHEIFANSDNKIAAIMFKDLHTWLAMESNRRLDRISMWNSIEARSPFQSEPLIGAGYNLMNEKSFSKLDKRILKESYPELEFLPVNQNKIGFISPVGFWLRENPAMVKIALNELNQYIPVNKNYLKSLIDAPNQQDFNKIKLVWGLVVLFHWLKL